MELTKLLVSLSDASFIAGRGRAADVALDALKPYSPDAFPDAQGNIIAPFIAPGEDGEHILLEAHLDEIGFIVTHIDRDGFLRVAAVGGPDARVLLGEEVTVFGKEELYGVFCCRPPHLSTGEDRKTAPKINGMAIDIGFSKEEAEKRVPLGSFVTLRREAAELRNGFLTGKAFDNRAGVAAVLRALDLLRGEDLSVGITAALCTSEELGERGAKTAAFSIKPTRAIVVDTSFALTPDAPPEKCGELAKGPMIGVSPILDSETTAGLFAAAKAENIPFQTEVMSGDTGTDSDAISVSRAGVKTGLASVPLRYMHTASETISPDDVDCTARVIAGYVKSFGRGRSHV